MDKDSKDILIAGLIGAALGVAAVSLYYASTSRSTGNLGRVMARVGEMLDGHEIGAISGLQNAERKIDKYEETVSDLLGLISTGIQLFNKIKKGI